MISMNVPTRSLGELQVPPVGMGTWKTFDVSTKEEIAVRGRIIDACLACGVTFLDTSPMYGQSERVLGIAIRNRRERVQLATKVCTTGLGAGRAQIAQSFKLLGTEKIDVFQIHNLVDWQTHLPVLEEMKGEGKIGLIGITHYDPAAYPELLRIMQTGRIGAIQIPYNVAERTCEAKILPAAKHLGIGVVVMKPLGVGRLAATLKAPPDLAPLREFGIRTWPQALLSWILSNPCTSVVIPATSKPERVAENAAVATMPSLSVQMREYVRREAERCVA